MTNYMSSHDLKKAYKMLRRIEDAIRDGKDSLAEFMVGWYTEKPNNTAPAEFVVELKRKIREATKYTNNWIMINSDSWSFTQLIECPKEIQTKDAAKEYFYENFYMERIPSMYDCTGQWGTELYYIAKRCGRMIVLHSAAMDV